MTTPTEPPAAAPPDGLTGQILTRYHQVLARYRQMVPNEDCPVARRWRQETDTSLADFPRWLASMSPRHALVKVATVLNAPLGPANRPLSAEPGAEVLLQMALLALMHLLAQHYAATLQSSVGPRLHLPMLQDTVLALLVACRHGVAVNLAVRIDSNCEAQLVVTNLITEREMVVAGVKSVQQNIDTELHRLWLSQQVLHQLLPPGSGLLGRHLPDDHVHAWVDEAGDKGLSPIVVLAWNEAEVARDIEQRWGVRTALRGDPATAPADSSQRAAALPFADAHLQVEPYFADMARLLRAAPVAPVAPVAQAAPPPAKPLVFISYAREDLALQQRLCTFLAQHRASVSTWTDQDLQPGQRWRQHLLDKLVGCQVAVLLLSADFNTSEFVQLEEMPEFQRRYTAGQLKVVPIVAGVCKPDYFAWLSELQLANPPEQPLLAMAPPPRDAALNGIAAHIAQIATQPTQDPSA